MVLAFMLFWVVAGPAPKVILALRHRDLGCGSANSLIPQGLALWTCLPLDVTLGEVQLLFSAECGVEAGENSRSFWKFLVDSIVLYLLGWLSGGNDC